MVEGLLYLLILVSVGFITSVLPGLALLARWSVAASAIALENYGPRDAWRRSIALTRGHYRRVMLLMAAIILLTLLLSSGPSLLAQQIGEFALPSEWRRGVARELFVVGIPELIDVVFKPIPLLAYTLLYYDLRVRAEGYDLLRRLAQNR